MNALTAYIEGLTKEIADASRADKMILRSQWCSRNAKSQPEAVMEHLGEGRASPGQLRCMQCAE